MAKSKPRDPDAKKRPEAIGEAVLRPSFQRIVGNLAERGVFIQGPIEDAIRKLFEEPGPLRAEADALGARMGALHRRMRGEMEASMRMAFGNRATAPVISAFAKGWPSPAEYKRLYMSEILPHLNNPPEETRYCAECGERFAPTDKRDLYCGPRCKARVASRGRPKARGGKSAAENARMKAERKLMLHMKTCRTCKVGSYCPIRETLLQVDDEMSRVVPGMDPEAPQEMAARGGKTPKRASDQERAAAPGSPAPRRKIG